MMARQVPLARRALFQDRRRAGLAAAGVAVALLLVLLLGGVVTGNMSRVTAYLRSSPADVIVSQQGVRTMHMSVSALPAATVAAAQRVDGVAWAEGLHYAGGMVTTATARKLSYIFGYDPAGHLGPAQLVQGRAPRSGEALIDKVAADLLGVGIGGPVEVFGQFFTVSGLFENGTSMVETTTFITAADYERMWGPSVAYVFVGGQPGVPAADISTRLAAALPQTTVQTRDQFVDSEASIVRDMAADVMQIMSTVGLLIALAVIGLTLFTLTLAKQREYAVVRALGSRAPRLGAVVLAQAGWLVGLALALAVVLTLVGSLLLASAAPSLPVEIEPASVVRVGAYALVVGALGALLPLRRVLRVDPATAFRRGS